MHSNRPQRKPCSCFSASEGVENRCDRKARAAWREGQIFCHWRRYRTDALARGLWPAGALAGALAGQTGCGAVLAACRARCWARP
eukprot:1847548-Pleurochrysis_carterae.AAC.2